jgi:hypothetical protein
MGLCKRVCMAATHRNDTLLRDRFRFDSLGGRLSCYRRRARQMTKTPRMDNNGQRPHTSLNGLRQNRAGAPDMGGAIRQDPCHPATTSGRYGSISDIVCILIR